MLVSEYIDQLSVRLRDSGHTQWFEVHKIDAVNDALRALTTFRPSVYTTNIDMALVAGVEQVATAGVNEIITFLHTEDSSGDIQRALLLGDQASMDQYFPLWRTDTPSAIPKYVFYDPEASKDTYYVWPPYDGAGGSTRATVAMTPEISGDIAADITSQPANMAAYDENMPINFNYLPILTEWVLYYSYSRDDADTQNFQKAGDHVKRFFDMLGMEIQSAAVVKGVRELLE